MESAGVQPFSACSLAWSLSCNAFTIPLFVHVLYNVVSVYCSNDENTTMRIWKRFEHYIQLEKKCGLLVLLFTSCGVSETSHQSPTTKNWSCECWKSRCLVPSRCHPGERTLYQDPCCYLRSWDTDTDACFSSVKGKTRTWVTCKDLQIMEEFHRRTCCNIHYVWREGILMVILLLLELAPEQSGRKAGVIITRYQDTLLSVSLDRSGWMLDNNYNVPQTKRSWSTGHSSVS